MKHGSDPNCRYDTYGDSPYSDVCVCRPPLISKRHDYGKELLAQHDRELRIATLIEAARLQCTRCRLGYETSMRPAGVVHLCDEGHLHLCAAAEITMRLALEWT